MPYTAKLRKVGGSIMLAIPPALLDALDLKSDTQVGMSIDSGRLLVEPRVQKRYTLEDLLAQCDPEAPEAADDHAWTEDAAAGRELI